MNKDLLEKNKIDKFKDIFIKKKDHLRKEFYKHHKAIKTCKNISETSDELLKELFSCFANKNNKVSRSISICAVGGYGRKQLAPFSDLDLLFLYSNEVNLKEVEEFIQFFIYPLWDLQLKVGYAVRSEKEAIDLSIKDHVIKTSMLDARFICGSKKIFKDTIYKFSSEVRMSGYDLLKDKIAEREEKLVDLGYDYFRNEPNIKESEGSLRDINLIFWALKIFTISKRKQTSKLLTRNEKKKLSESLEFLLLIRCLLHYEARRSCDKLTFDFQHQISRIIFSKKTKDKGLQDSVEKMMKNYFFQIRKTKNLAQIIVRLIKENFEQNTQITSPKKINLDNIFSKFLENLINSKNSVQEERLMFEFSSRIKSNTYKQIKTINYFKEILFSEKIDKIFLLNDLGILQKIVPEFSKILDLPQFDRYHSLTVGQHTLRALNFLKDLKSKKLRNNTYKFVYKILKRNEDLKPLYYSTLLHDIGKGSGDDHSKVGSRISSKVLKRLNEDNSTISETRWLIENHLLMSDLAFKRDLGDFSVIKKAAKKINSMERLINLFLLTALDISAVDQGLWNDWKARLLKTLYEKLEKEINRPSSVVSLNEKISLIKKDIIENSKVITSSIIDNVSRITYPNYWLLQSKEMITFQIEKFFEKKKIGNVCEIRKRSTENFFSVIIFTKDRPQLFLDLISIFTSEKISIHQARIFTLADETVIDTFTISLNLNKNLVYSKKYLNELKQKLSLQKPLQFEKASQYNFSNRNFLKKKIEIFFDNKLSSTYTVLTVITNDRLGLLYDLSKVLLKSKLVIFTAKITTNGDFVEDSFHLRTEYGSKFTNEYKIKDLESQIYTMLSQKLEYVY
jgi:[protein-PII] uridylyltransferase